VIDVDAAAMGIPGADTSMAILIEDVVLDINSVERLPEDEAVPAVHGHDVVVNFEIGDGGIAGDLNSMGGIGKQDVVDDELVFAANVQSVVEVAAGASVVMNEVCAVDVAAGRFIRIDAILSLSAGTGGVSVVMDVAVKDLVVVGPDGDTTFGAVLHFEPVDDVIATVDIEADVAIGGVLAINDSSALNFRFKCDWAGGCPALAQMNSPATVVISVCAGFHDDGGTGRGQAVCLNNCVQWL